MRVQILKNYVKENFPATPVLDYALAVEKITTSKVRLILRGLLLIIRINLYTNLWINENLNVIK